MNVLKTFEYVGEVKVHFDPSPRQEYLPLGTKLSDTPDVYLRRINAILKGRRDILGFTDVEVRTSRGAKRRCENVISLIEIQPSQ